MHEISDIQKAVGILQKGGILIFPTDTAWGIGCRVDNEESVKRLYEIRKRPITKAMSILVDSIDMTRLYTDLIEPKVEELMKKYWPGGLTIVLKANMEKIPEIVRGGGTTIGVRMPRHDSILSLIKELGVPILGPSANFSGEKTPFKKEDLNPELIRLADGIFEGEAGGSEVSTVIDCANKEWKILRQGSVSVSV